MKWEQALSPVHFFHEAERFEKSGLQEIRMKSVRKNFQKTETTRKAKSPIDQGSKGYADTHSK